MKKIYTIIAAVLLTATGLLPQQLKAQSPEKMSYQAVVRSSSNNLIVNQAVGMQISILQGTSTGTAVYVETHNPTTNANGLISIEIGNGTVVSGDFGTIDWTDGPYYIKTETDPNGGNAYSITGTSQLLSVPYALFAKTADSVTTPESDPIYMSSVAAAISASDTTYWNAKLDSFVEVDPIFAASIAAGITGLDTTYWNNKLDNYTETDPIYTISVASGITAIDTAYWNGKMDTFVETDPLFTSSLAAAISSLDTTHWGMVYSWGNHNTAGYFGNGGEATGADRSLGNLDSNYLTFLTDSVTRITITGDGKVGIGVDTPMTDFEVGGNSKFSGISEIEGSNNDGVLVIKETSLPHTSVHNAILNITNSSGVTNSQANIKFNAGANGHGRAIISSQSDGYGGYYGGLLNFKVRYGATSYRYALTIRASGRIGMGTTNPQAPLHVYGRIYQSGLGYSTFIGAYAGHHDNLNSNNNSYVGYNAGYYNINGYYNSALGFYALYHNTGNDNTAIGARSMQANTTGSRNAGVGGYSMNLNTSGADNVAIGYNSLRTNTTGSNNTAIGSNAANKNTTGASNTAIGSQSLYNNTIGHHNTATGFYSLNHNTTGYYNTATGYNALAYNTSGHHNTANGVNSQYRTSTGSYNTSSGYYSLYYNTTGYNNLANGAYSLYRNINGAYNTANGYYSLYYNTSGHHNTANGAYSLNRNSSGYYNAAGGYYSLFNNTYGRYNTAFGARSLYNTTYGNYNTAFGYYAHTYSTTSYGTAVGYNAYAYGNNTTVIGNGAYTGGSNRVYLGNSSVTYIGGHSAWYNTSDARTKRNIQEDVVGLDFILNLRPVTYFFDKDKMDELNGVTDSSDYAEKYEINNIKQSGFLAQEVEAAANKVGYDFIGISKPTGDVKTYSLSYAMFVVPLVKATQEQQKVIEQQQQTIDEMKKELAEIKAMLLEKK